MGVVVGSLNDVGATDVAVLPDEFTKVISNMLQVSVD